MKSRKPKRSIKKGSNKIRKITRSRKPKRIINKSIKKAVISVKTNVIKDKIYFIFYKGSEKLKYSDGLNLLQDSDYFRKLCTSTLKSVKFKAYRLKLTAINRKTDISRKDKYFKLTVIDDPGLYNRVEDNSRFKQYFSTNKCDKYFCSITSPSGNELLIPTPIQGAKANAYVHISNFIKYAPVDQVNYFWKFLSKRMLLHIKNSGKPTLFLNTHGHDVPWLHVRLDTNASKIIWK